MHKHNGEMNILRGKVQKIALRAKRLQRKVSGESVEKGQHLSKLGSPLWRKLKNVNAKDGRMMDRLSEVYVGKMALEVH